MANPNAHSDSGNSTPPSNTSTNSPGFRIGNVIKVVVPFVLLGSAVIVFVGFFDGAAWLATLTNPPLVSASGLVMYQGEPLKGAQIATRHANRKLKGSMGWTDDDGRFALQTDFEGYVDGAYAGEQQVVVTAHKTINAPATPPLLTPKKYASFGTTPLRIIVSPDASKNEYVLILEGDPPQQANLGPGGSEDGVESGGGEFDPETFIGRVFDDYDKDNDDQLSGAEMQGIEGNRGDLIRQADANEDGIVDRDELVQALSTPPPK